MYMVVDPYAEHKQNRRPDPEALRAGAPNAHVCLIDAVISGVIIASYGTVGPAYRSAAGPSPAMNCEFSQDIY